MKKTRLFTCWTCLGEGGSVERLYMIELKVVLFLLMSFSRMVSMFLVLRRVGPILGNGYGSNTSKSWTHLPVLHSLFPEAKR